MKKPSVRALTAALLLSGTALAAQAEDKVCLYEHAEYQGAEWCYGVGDNSWIGSSRSDKVSSIKLYATAHA